MNVLIIYPNGRIEGFERSEPPKLEEVQAWVEGYIERVPWFDKYEGEDAQMWVNEEGLLENKAYNAQAAAISGYHHSPLVGTAVLLKGKACLE